MFSWHIYAYKLFSVGKQLFIDKLFLSIYA